MRFNAGPVLDWMIMRCVDLSSRVQIIQSDVCVPDWEWPVLVNHQQARDEHVRDQIDEDKSENQNTDPFVSR